MTSAIVRNIVWIRDRLLLAKFRMLPGIVLALVLSGPVHAERVICDGNLLCFIAIIPVAAVVMGINALTPLQPEKSAEQDIRTSNNAHLQTILQSHPAMLDDLEKSHGLLLIAASAGNLGSTTMLVHAGVAANYGDSRALWYATTVAEIELLLSYGASAAEVNLSSMVYRFNSPIVTDLLNAILGHRGILDPDDPGALTLLVSAADQRQFAVISLLLQRGVNPNGKPDRSTLIALANACNEEDVGCAATILLIARELIGKGANANFAETRYCNTPIQAATQRHNHALIALLQSAGAIENAPAQMKCRFWANRDNSGNNK